MDMEAVKQHSFVAIPCFPAYSLRTALKAILDLPFFLPLMGEGCSS